MKSILKFKLSAIVLILAVFLVACGNNNLISTKEYDFFTKLREVEDTVAPISKKLTEDMYLSQTEMNELSSEVLEMWDEFLDEVEDALEDNLSKKAYKAFEQEQEAWEKAADEEVKAYATEFGGGSIAPLISNMEMAEKIKYRVYDLAKYFTRP